MSIKHLDRYLTIALEIQGWASKKMFAPEAALAPLTYDPSLELARLRGPALLTGLPIGVNPVEMTRILDTLEGACVGAFGLADAGTPALKARYGQDAIMGVAKALVPLVDVMDSLRAGKEPPPSLDAEDISILQALQKCYPERLTQRRIEVKAQPRVSRRTIARHMPQLEADGLIVQPHGHSDGYTITEAGRKLLALLHQR